MNDDDPIVFLIDDDAAVRLAIESLLLSVGMRIESYSSPKEFLERPEPNGPCCLVVDVRLPSMSGTELQRHLTAIGRNIPVIFITGHGDIPMSVEAMKAGAIDFLTKPVRGQSLLDTIQSAIGISRTRRAEETRLAELRKHFNSLTRREREVMERVLNGQLNREIAVELGTSERTVKLHRSSVMRKMGADTLPDLVRMAVEITTMDKPRD